MQTELDMMLEDQELESGDRWVEWEGVLARSFCGDVGDSGERRWRYILARLVFGFWSEGVDEATWRWTESWELVRLRENERVCLCLWVLPCQKGVLLVDVSGPN